MLKAARNVDIFSKAAWKTSSVYIYKLNYNKYNYSAFDNICVCMFDM